MSIKESNEITVKIKGSIENLYKILEERIYKIVDKFYMDDYYYIPANLEIEKMTTREILAKAVIVRNIKNEMYDRCNKKITFKIKEIDDKGNILKQEALNCEVINTDDAKKLLNAIGFKEIMNIIETEERDGFRTTEELKKTVNGLDIPIETNNYFVKKAEIELSKILNKN